MTPLLLPTRSRLHYVALGAKNHSTAKNYHFRLGRHVSPLFVNAAKGQYF